MIRSLTLAVLLAPAAATAAEPAKLTPRQRGDLAIQARHVLKKYCAECHGEQPVRGTLDILDHKRLVAGGPNPVPFVSASRSQVLEFLRDGSMPPAGGPRPTDEEIAALEQWAQADAPSFPRAFDDRTVLAAMLADLDKQQAGDVPHLRYVSLAHLVRDGEPPPNLTAVEAKLAAAIQAASGRPLNPVPVDDTATLYRLDLRAAGWDTPDLFDKIEEMKATRGVAPVVAFDLVLLEYPDGFALPGTDKMTPRLDKFLAAARQARPVPFVRGDWLAAVLAPGQPLAAEMKSLVELGDALDKKGAVPDGPKPRPFLGAKPVTIAAAPPGLQALPIPPFGAFYAGDVEADPPPFKLTVDLVDDKSGEPLKTVPVGTPFRVRLSGEREPYFIVMEVLPDGEVRIVPVKANRLDRDKPRLVGTSSGKGFQVSSSLGDSADEHFVVLAAEDDVPLPTVVRSKHPENPIWRFVFDPTAGPQRLVQARIVRKVVRVPVGKKP